MSERPSPLPLLEELPEPSFLLVVLVAVGMRFFRVVSELDMEGVERRPRSEQGEEEKEVDSAGCLARREEETVEATMDFVCRREVVPGAIEGRMGPVERGLAGEEVVGEAEAMVEVFFIPRARDGSSLSALPMPLLLGVEMGEDAVAEGVAGNERGGVVRGALDTCCDGALCVAALEEDVETPS